jgi:hypothetical protein
MMSIPFSRIGEALEFVEAIGCISAVPAVIRAVGLKPRDRVLRCETLALATLSLTLTIGAIYFHFDQGRDPSDFLWLTPLLVAFLVFAALAGYFGLINLLRGRKRSR